MFRPRSVSSLAAQPSLIPEPTTMALKVLVSLEVIFVEKNQKLSLSGYPKKRYRGL
jgi:hypothetical protein